MDPKLKQEIYEWLKVNCKDEMKEDQTEDQNLYKTRKKALGPFKNKIWTQDKKYKDETLIALKTQFEYLFTQLNLFNTKIWIET